MHVLRRTPVHKPVNDRLMIPHDVGVLYVKRNGAVPPQRSCFRFAVLSSLQRGNCVKQIVERPARNECQVGRMNAIGNEYTIL